MRRYFPQIVASIKEVLDLRSVDTLTEGTLLEADLGMDSGLMLELIMQLEETIDGLVIDQVSITSDNFRSIGSICDYVKQRVSQNAMV